MLRVRIGDTCGRMLDRVVCSCKQFSFQMFLESGITAITANKTAQAVAVKASCMTNSSIRLKKH